MKEKRVIWLVRHGERVDNVDPNWRRTATHWDDPPLTARGNQQAREVGIRLAGERIDRFIASPFTRTIETARGILSQRTTKTPLAIEPGIGETLNSCDSPPGRPPMETIRNMVPVDDDYHAVYDALPEEVGGDIGCYARVRHTLLTILSENKGNLVLVSHGSPIAVCQLVLLGKWYYNGQCTISKIIQYENGTFKPEMVGDKTHLSDKRNLHEQQSKEGEYEKGLLLEKRLREQAQQ